MHTCLGNEYFKLTLFRSFKGTTFFALGDPHEANIDLFLQQIYELYCNFVLKNPYWDYDQPIHNACEKFVSSVAQLIHNHNTGHPYLR